MMMMDTSATTVGGWATSRRPNCNTKPCAGRTLRARARKEWEEYEDALVQKDLARALGSLKSLQQPLLNPDDAVRVLDTCLDARDMDLVCAAYAYLKDRGFLLHFAKFRHIVLEEEGGKKKTEVTPCLFMSETGLDVTKLISYKSGFSVPSILILVAFLGGCFLLLSRGIDIRTYLAAIFGLAFADTFLLGGTCSTLITTYWPPFRRRVLVHEAGHLLLAYLMGFAIRGVILNPFATQGQAVTRNWDEEMSRELDERQLSRTTFDRYCMVLFAGIAAEALVYGEVNGAEDDEDLYWRICALMEPPLSEAEMSNQARWSVLQAYNLLKRHRDAHTAAVKALGDDESLSSVIMRVEEAISAGL